MPRLLDATRPAGSAPGRPGTAWEVVLDGGRRTYQVSGSALSRGGRSLRITGLPHGTTAVRVHLAPGVLARGHRCSLSAWLRAASGAPPVHVIQRC